VLGLPAVGRGDNFFELGGHSLLATTLLTRINQHLGIQLRIADMFTQQTLCDFAEYVDLVQRQSAPVDKEQYSTFEL
jgi:cytochrome c